MRVVWHCTDPVGASMAGPGIRAVELARRLAARHEVLLVAPGARALEGEPFAVDEGAAALRAGVRSSEAFVTMGFGFPFSTLRGFDGRLVLDLYDPVQLEQLARFGDAPSPDERTSLLYVRARLHLLLRRADHVLCASPAQRALWLGWLGATGRLTPEALAGDPEARRLLALVPFGVPELAPVSGDHPLRAPLGLGADVPLALWSGGLWDWMDPALAVRAVRRLRDDGRLVHLVLLAGAHPGGSPMRAAADEARAVVRDLGVSDRVHFLERWIPYAERGAVLLDADLAVTAHRPTLESELAFRTRLLDCLWARLPAAVTRGDVLAASAEQDGWGAAADPGDVDGFAAAIARLVDPANRARAREAAARVAGRFTWARSAAVLEELLSAGAPPRPGGLVPGELAANGPFGAAWAVAQKLGRRLFR